MRCVMNKAGASLLLTAIVAGVIIGDQFLVAPWKFVVWGAGLCSPWIVVSRFVTRLEN